MTNFLDELLFESVDFHEDFLGSIFKDKWACTAPGFLDTRLSYAAIGNTS